MNLYTAVITLILILDPFGNIPLFLAELKDFDSKKRRIIIIRETIFAFIILSCFLFFGKYILKGLNISPPALSVSGGIILFIISIRMIFPGKNTKPEIENSTEVTKEEPLIVPLAIPLIAGPSAMAFVILSSSRYPDQRLMLFVALTIAIIVSFIVLFLSDFIRKILGSQALRAIERLMGMILTTMSVQMFLSGLNNFFNL